MEKGKLTLGRSLFGMNILCGTLIFFWYKCLGVSNDEILTVWGGFSEICNKTNIYNKKSFNPTNIVKQKWYMQIKILHERKDIHKCFRTGILEIPVRRWVAETVLPVLPKDIWGITGSVPKGFATGAGCMTRFVWLALKKENELRNKRTKQTQMNFNNKSISTSKSIHD